jgi:serine/threonine-protein kinase HipA
MSPRPSPPALNVRWHDGRLVGRVIAPGPTYFAYDEEWLAKGHSLSPLSVPFDNTAYRQRIDGFDQLPGFLADCIPDQWGRRLMDQEFSERGIRPTPMRMLAWVGGRAMGALKFEPALGGDHSESSWEAVTPLLLSREAQAVLRHENTSAFRNLQRGGSPGGALPKATVARLPDGTLLIGGNVADAALQHPDARMGILKIECEDTSEDRITDGRLEHAYTLMAQAAGIRTVRTEVIVDSSGTHPLHHLFVDRFDCAPGSPRRIHLLTLAGALNTHNLDYRNLLVTTRQLTRDHREVLEAVRRMIYNVRSGNADDHGKNHSFMLDERANQWTLSPAYDLTLNFTEGRQYRGLFPATFGTSPRRSILVDVAADGGVIREEFDELDNQVINAIGRWNEIAHEAHVPEAMIGEAARVHGVIAASLATESIERPGRRRRIWE